MANLLNTSTQAMAHMAPNRLFSILKRMAGEMPYSVLASSKPPKQFKTVFQKYVPENPMHKPAKGPMME